jgi:hypothetical protein
LRLAIETLSQGLGELKTAHEELQRRFERFTHISPESIAELERGLREEADDMKPPEACS